MSRINEVPTVISDMWRGGLILLAVLASVVVGVSPLVFSSPVSPLATGGLVVVMIVSVFLMEKPIWALYAAIFVVFLPAVRGETQLAQAIDSLQLYLNRGVTLIALASWLLSLIIRRQRVVLTMTTLFMIFFLSWSVVTLAWAPDMSRGLGKVGQYAFRLALYLLLVLNEIDDKQTLDGLMRTLVVNGWILMLAGVVVVLFQGYAPGNRLHVLGMDENEFGTKLLVILPAIIWQVFQTSEYQKPLRTTLSIMFIALALLLVAFSGSRGSAISWLASLIMLWFWRPTRLWGRLGLLILAISIVVAPYVFSTLIERFSEDTSLGGRLFIWHASWLLIRDHPWGGVGIGNAGHILLDYLNQITSHFRYREEMVSHNAVLQIWVETGTIGMLLYVSVLVSAAWSFVVQYIRYHKQDIGELLVYFPIVASISVGVLLWWIKGGSAAYDPMFFMLLAFLVIPSRIHASYVSIKKEHHAQKPKLDLGAAADLVSRSSS